MFLVDPDGGTNVQNKLQGAHLTRTSEDIVLVQAIPDVKDNLWSNEIYKAPKVTYSSIFQFLVDRKVLIKKANHIENVIERRDSSDLGIQTQGDVHSDSDSQGNKNSDTATSESICYTRTLDKAYRFFQDGHVQNIRYHPMPSLPDYVCIGASVLPSMKKGKMYSVRIVLSKRTAHVERAICVCPAGLSGCCNHVTATLYCVQDYFHLKINEEDEKGCTEKRQTWNQPKQKKVDARPTNLVTLTKKVYGIEKRPKLCRVNQWDCRPTSRRTLHPEKKANLRSRLSQIQEIKIKAAAGSVSSAVTDVEKKKAIEAQSMLLRYGTSCFLQLFDEEPSTSDDRLQKTRNERIAKAAAKRSQFQLDIAGMTKALNHDHDYCSIDLTTQFEIDSVPAPQHMVRSLYEEHVCISPREATELEMKTREQSDSSLWHEQRKCRITASIMKTVCHRKAKTNVMSFVCDKLAPKHVRSPAIEYGRRNEDSAIQSYIDYQRKKGIVLKVHKCGLWVDPSKPWLAASPDAILELGEDKGCLEVKCPYLCASKSIAQAVKKSPSFCLQNNNGMMQLKRSHQYFYQIQLQLFVTRLLWCHFVIWTPNEIFVEEIHYDQNFVEVAVSKARKFYFNVYLPAIVSCFLIHDSYVQISDLRTMTESIEIETISEFFGLLEKMVSLESTGCRDDTSMLVSMTNGSTKQLPSNDSEKLQRKVDSEDISIVCVSKVNNPLPSFNVLEKLHYMQHKVYGDGDCLYHAIAHQAGFIKPNSHGDPLVAKQLRILASQCMQEYPDVRLEDGATKVQWEMRKTGILQSEWGGDLEIRLLAIAIGRQIVVVTGSENTFTSARRFPCHPPPIPKMRGGIFVPVEITELYNEWKNYKPSPLLIIYNGVNHYDSTMFTC